MGWTSYMATHYKNGKVDRKAEMDERWTQKEHDGYPELNVLKSSMKGSTYYAAIEVKRNGVREQVFATVALTSTATYDGMNFGYKDMDETMGPYAYDCPKGILDLLTPTDNEVANEWRKKCREKRPLSSLPIGTKIRFKQCDNVIELVKCAPAYQFKRAWWYNAKNNTYFKANHIPENYEIVKEVNS